MKAEDNCRLEMSVSLDEESMQSFQLLYAPLIASSGGTAVFAAFCFSPGALVRSKIIFLICKLLHMSIERFEKERRDFRTLSFAKIVP